MNSTEQLIYSFALYFLWITLPLIPAVLIYKIFPKTRTGVSGLLGQLKINATGAFAAYLIVSVLGFFIIKHIQGLITNAGYQTWEITAQLQFLDKNNKLHPDQENLIKQANITLEPFFIKNQNSDFVQFLATGIGRDIKVNFSGTENFNTKSIDLQNDKSIRKIDEPNRKIDLGIVEIKETQTQYNIPADKGISDTTAGPPITLGGQL